MTTDTNTLSPEQELDLSAEGLQRTRANFEITDAELNPSKKGNGTVLHISYESLEPVDEQENFRADDYIVTQHPKRGVVKGGMAKLKRIFTAVYGVPSGSINALKGKQVSAEVWEDDEGFRRIGRYQPVEVAAELAGASAGPAVTL